MKAGPDGEIGRRSGLKIRGPERAVGVQVPLRAPGEKTGFTSSYSMPLGALLDFDEAVVVVLVFTRWAARSR